MGQTQGKGKMKTEDEAGGPGHKPLIATRTGRTQQWYPWNLQRECNPNIPGLKTGFQSMKIVILFHAKSLW